MSKMLAPFQRVGANLVRTFGRNITLTYVTGATYSTATGTMTPTTSDVTVRGVISNYREDEIGDLIEEGDLKITVAALGLTEPQLDDTVTIASVAYQVVGVDHLSVGTNAALYEIQVRR